MTRSRIALLLLALFAAVVLLLPLTFGLPGGTGPPDAITESGDAINQVYWVVFGLATAVFLIVEITLIAFMFRFRRRVETPDDVEGPQIHGNTRVEVVWTLVPALLLLGLAIYTFLRVPDVEAKPGGAEMGELVTVEVVGHQFYWEYRYENGALSYDTLYLPVDRKARLEITSRDVPHSWWVPQLTGKRDAIPGQTNLLYFTPREVTRLESGVCGEFCGIQHARMVFDVEILSEEDFEGWLADNEPQADDAELGETQWAAACAKCHGLDGRGGIGPSIAGNPTLTDFDALSQLVREEGQNLPGNEGYMPPVGKGWSDEQLRALIAYVESSEELGGGGGDGS